METKELVSELRDMSKGLLADHQKAEIKLASRLAKVEILNEVIDELSRVDYFFGPTELIEILVKKLNEFEV